MNPFNKQQKIRKVTSTLFVVWLSGFIFLFCCGSAKAWTETDYCPLAKTKSHCKKAEQKDLILDHISSAKFDCCGFLPAVFDKTRKIEKNQLRAYAAGRLKIERPVFSFVRNDAANLNFYRPPPFQSKKIFIINRVFRI